MPHSWKFKARLDVALSNLNVVDSIPAHGRGWNEMILKVTSNPNHFVILRFYHNSFKNWWLGQVGALQ